MASIQEGFLLCNLQESSLLGITVSSFDNHVIITQDNRRIRVYNVADQKLIYDWPVQTGQFLTCPCVQSSSGTQFSVIIGSQLIHTWAQTDFSVDKGHKTKLPKTAHRLFSFEDGMIVLYADGSIGSLNNLLYEGSSSSNHLKIVWCDAVAKIDKNYVVAVFCCTDQDSNKYLVRKYAVSSDLSSVYVETTKFSPVSDGRQPISFCLQSLDEDYFLIALYGNGVLSRTRLSDSPQSSADTEQLCPLSIVNAVETGLAVVAIDSTQVAVVSPSNRDDQRMGLGIWDTRFGIFHSWISLPDTKQCNTLVFSPSGHLIVPCSSGVYVYPVVIKRATLASSMGKLMPVISTDKSDIPTEVHQTLQRLAQPTDTPTRSSFKKAFGALRSWLPQCDVDSKLKIIPAVTAVIQRCVDDERFLPTDEILMLVDAHVVTPSACSQLCTAFAAHQEIDALLKCLTTVKDLPESSVVTALSCFLSVDDSKFTGAGLTLNGHDIFGDPDTEYPSAVFSKQKASYINQLLTLEYSSPGLLEALHQLKSTHVVDLIHHLEYLLYNTSPTVSVNNQCVPSLAQVVDWLSLLVDARYAEIALSKDITDLHSRLQRALQLQRQDIETLHDINKNLRQILCAKKDANKKHVGSYCITVLRMN